MRASKFGGTPFEEDCALLGFLERFGLDLDRRVSMEITDPKALEEQGLMRKCPDYAKIRRLLNEGAIVQGARLTGVEYVLRKRREPIAEGTPSTDHSSAG